MPSNCTSLLRPNVVKSTFYAKRHALPVDDNNTNEQPAALLDDIEPDPEARHGASEDEKYRVA